LARFAHSLGSNYIITAARENEKEKTAENSLLPRLRSSNRGIRRASSEGGEGETRVHARENFKGTAVPLTTSENSAARAKTTLVSRPPCYANSGSPMKLRVISIAPRLVTLNDR
jgi:hypothetical protein